MGAIQSKRSVDISTAPGNTVAEGTGELKKIEDIDQPLKANGETNHAAGDGESAPNAVSGILT